METWCIPDVRSICWVSRMKKYDIVIVGAGPAGSTAAKVLAEKGAKVLLIDKQKFPRDKACGGGLPTKVMKRFPYMAGLIDTITYGSIMYSSSLRYQMRVVRDRPLLFMIQRKIFDKGLVDIAVEKGTTFVDKKTVVDLKIENDKALIILDDGEKIESQLVIGCDGTNSVVVEKAHLIGKKEKKCICIYQETPMSKKQLDTYFTEKKITHIFIKAQGIAGYGWIFPKKKHVNVGLGEFESAVDPVRPKVNLRDTYEQFITALKEKNILPADFSIDKLKGGILPIYPLEKTYASRVLICGDAAGFINPITGEGIYYAMVSGELAAKLAYKALQSHDTSEQFLSRYEKQWKREFGRDLEQLGRFNYQWGQDTEKIVRLISSNKTFAKLTVGIMGGQLRYSRYKYFLFLAYLYASLKNSLISKRKTAE